MSTQEPASTEPAADDMIVRHTATISSLNLISRVTGFVRMLVVAAVLGTTFLGNTYQTANSIPNLVFELFAAGALQAVLVPTIVEALEQRGREEARRIANLVLGSLVVAMVVVLAAGLALAPLISRALFAGSPAGGQQVRLGTVFLWLFLPQVLFYAAGLVATAVLNADHHFAVPAFAPVINNVIVTSAYVGFWVLRNGKEPSLHLRPIEVLVLAGGTTLGVVAFTTAPVVMARRRGMALWPRWERRSPELTRFWRQGAWAAAYLALTQALLVTVLVLANRVEGGVVAYQLGFTFFLLPHALVAIPVFTALFPRMARTALAEEDAAYADLVRRGIATIAVVVLPATAALVALALPLARLTLFGHGDAGVHQVALATAWFAPGLVPYGVFLLLTRAAYARNDARLPAVANLVATLVGISAMVVAAATLDGDARIAGLAAAHSLTYGLGSVVLAVALGRRLTVPASLVDGRALAVAIPAAAVAGAVMAAAGAVSSGGGRAGAALELAVGGTAGLLVYGVALWMGRLGDPRNLLAGGSADG